MARVNTDKSLDAKAISEAVALLCNGLDDCDSERAARDVADTTRQRCLELLAMEMELLKAAQTEITARPAASIV